MIGQLNAVTGKLLLARRIGDVFGWKIGVKAIREASLTLVNHQTTG